MMPAAVLKIDQRIASLSEFCIDHSVWSLANLLSVERSPKSRPDQRQRYLSLIEIPMFKTVGVSQLSPSLLKNNVQRDTDICILDPTVCTTAAQKLFPKLFSYLLLSALFYFDINSPKICHGSSSINHPLICGESSMRTEWSCLTRGDNRWPLRQDSPSLVWTLWTLRLKQHSPWEQAEWHWWQGGSQPPLTDTSHPGCHLALSPTMARCRHSDNETTLYWHQAADILIQELKDYSDHWFSILGKMQKASYHSSSSRDANGLFKMLPQWSLGAILFLPSKSLVPLFNMFKFHGPS